MLKKNPEIVTVLEKFIENDIAGDPISSLKWVRKSTRKVALELQKYGYSISKNTVARLLKNMGFSLRVNRKRIEAGGKCLSPSKRQARDLQFYYISLIRDEYQDELIPIISVDTKKRELIGNFKNNGRIWCQEPVDVNDHDFRSESDGIGIPYGIYDVLSNCGFVVVGKTYDTPAFAVDSIALWWEQQGSKQYFHQSKILILADCGGKQRGPLPSMESSSSGKDM